MEGLLVYNGKEDWYKVFFHTGAYFYNTSSTRLEPASTPIADSSKPYFKIGGPKCLIRW